MAIKKLADVSIDQQQLSVDHKIMSMGPKLGGCEVLIISSRFTSWSGAQRSVSGCQTVTGCILAPAEFR